MPSPGLIDRLGKIGLASVLAAGAMFPLAAAPAAAATATAVPATASTSTPTGIDSGLADGQHLLRSTELDVVVSAAFPQVFSYTDRATDASLAGNPAVLSSLSINGAAQPVAVTSSVVDETSVDYVITPTDLDDVVIEARLSLADNVVTFAVTKITDPDAAVKSLQIPGHDLVTVSSAEAGASVAVANLSVNRNVSGDTFIPVTAATPLDATAKGSNAIIANTSQLAAAFATNALYDTSSGASNKDSGNFFRQAVSDGAGGVEVGVSSGPWLYRADRATDDRRAALDQGRRSPPTPTATTRSTGRTARSRSATSAWLRSRAATTPRQRVVTHIPFNFASPGDAPVPAHPRRRQAHLARDRRPRPARAC